MALRSALRSTTPLASLLVSFALGACGGDSFVTGSSDGGSPPGTDGGVDANVTPQPDGGACDLTKDAKDQPACLTDAIGVFVNPAVKTGQHAGTKADPVGSLKEAIAIARQSQRARIYVAAGTLSEDLALVASPTPISIFGGFVLPNWTYSGKDIDRPVIGKSNIAGTIASVGGGMMLQDLAFNAAAPTGDGESSIALIVSQTSALQISRCTFTASSGKDGVKGQAQGYQYQGNLDGKSANGSNGGSQTINQCANNLTSVGGAGGDNGFDGKAGTPGNGNAGTVAACSNNNTGGGTGAGGSNGTDGEVPGFGAPSQTGTWTPGKGGAGKDGAIGQGGGGGAGTQGGGGGGGGAGGCGGRGGEGGSGGGSSFGVVVSGLNSQNVTISNSTITTGSGGNGGDGQPGFSGQTGGNKGSASGAGCQGGGGGKGGTGGGGAGGAGGLSIGVLGINATPKVDNNTTGAIKSGSGGKGGAAGGTSNTGPTGLSAGVLSCSVQNQTVKCQ